MTINYPPVTEREFLKKYLEMTNLLRDPDKQLMQSEMDLIVEFALLPEEKFHYQRFSPLAKTKVKEAVKSKGKTLSNININNKLYSLVEKEFLTRDEDKVLYLPKYLLLAYSEFKKHGKFSVNINYTRSENKAE